MSVVISIIKHMSDINLIDDQILNTDPIPVQQLEARICELAGHLTAATCRFLELVADFDARQGWASWEMGSCAAWLSWKCQIAPGTAREHVRVARALPEMPLIRAEFAAARLSYAKVRALTRIADADNEADLAQMALAMTAGQLERFARAHRRVTDSDGARARSRRQFRWGWVDDHEFSFRGQLPPEQAAVVLQALRAAMDDLEHPHDNPDGVSAETRAEALARQDERDGTAWDQPLPPPRRKEDTESLADALVGICADYLAGRARQADNPDTYQVIIHAGTAAISAAQEPGDVPAETRRALAALAETVPLLAFPESHPAWPARSHLEDGAAIGRATLQTIACNATISTMLHDADGSILNVGRRTRKLSAALRRAVRERDRHRCRYPGCESRRVDAHHIRYWSNGGETKLGNLISLCKAHHHLVHDKSIIIAATSGGGFTFYLPGGGRLSNSPPLPAGDPAAITECHGAEVTPATIVSPHSGGRLDLNMAVWVAVTNAEVRARRRQQAAQAAQTQAA
jgi:5-methylcytosine-specific restriction endonuclease McrA